jgi:hypothetical protein
MVWHGPWVETRPDRFFEGTWDGSFSEGRFDDAVSFAGSGGAVKPRSVTFACPTNMCERLYSVRTDGELLISNSIVFLFEQSRDAPEPSYPHYVRDIVSIHRDGLTRSDRSWIPTRRGRRLFLHGCVNPVVSPELTITCAAKAQPIAPASYGDYVALLEGTLDRVLRNAADPARLKVYRPVVTVSKGYDSPAVAVLLARLGCSEAVTLLRTAGSQTEDDSGTAIGERLGFHVTEYERLGYLRLPGMPEAEFCTSDYGSNVPLAVMEQQLVGTVLFTGRHGDVVWSTDRARFLPMRRVPHAISTYGGSQLEFRLRVGFVHFPVPYILSLETLPVYRISTSGEMRRWSVGGDYDRPIPRRILEEAGIPRGWFAKGKRATIADNPFKRFDAKRASHRELRAFAESVQPAAQKLFLKVMHRVHRADAFVTRWAERIARALGADLRLYAHIHERHRIQPTFAAFSFQWGIEKIRRRYAAATSERQ